MSNTILVGYDPVSAGSYNYRRAKTFGLPHSIPKGAVKKYPALAKNWRSSSVRVRRAISDAVLQLQQGVGFAPSSCDGKYGPNTHRMTTKAFAPIKRITPHLVIAGVRVPVEQVKSVILGLDDPENKTDLHRSGNFGRRRTGPIRRVVIHWGGRDIGHLYRYFSGTPKNVSSHGACSFGVSAQFLDLDFVAYHAGRGDDGSGWNNDSVGYDCAQFPQPDRLHHYSRTGPHNISRMENPERSSGRGLSPILRLDQTTANAMRDLVFGTLAALDLEPKCPRSADGAVSHDVISKAEADRQGITVVGHHHIRRTKPDIIGWWSAIFGGTSLG